VQLVLVSLYPVAFCNQSKLLNITIMKAIKIQYTVRQEFAAKNGENIVRVMEALRQLNNNDIKYSSFLTADQKSFVHFVIVKNDEANNILTGLAAFKTFQAALKDSEPEIPPTVEKLFLIGSSYDFFS